MDDELNYVFLPKKDEQLQNNMVLKLFKSRIKQRFCQSLQHIIKPKTTYTSVQKFCWDAKMCCGLGGRMNIIERAPRAAQPEARRTTNCLKVRDVVIVKSDEKNWEKWQLGIVEHLYPGRDGVVRAVKLRAGKNYLERPVNHLYLLKLSCDRETSKL